MPLLSGKTLILGDMMVVVPKTSHLHETDCFEGIKPFDLMLMLMSIKGSVL